MQTNSAIFNAESKNLFGMNDRLQFAGDYARDYPDWWDKWVSI